MWKCCETGPFTPYLEGLNGVCHQPYFLPVAGIIYVCFVYFAAIAEVWIIFIGNMSFIQLCCERGAKSHVAKEISGRGRRRGRDEKDNQGVGYFRFTNFLQFVSIYFFFNYFTLSFFFYTHDIYPHPHPRPTTSTHYPRPTTFSFIHVKLTYGWLFAKLDLDPVTWNIETFKDVVSLDDRAWKSSLKCDSKKASTIYER